MSSTITILNIESAPGDAPRAVEQINGDLLLPAAARPLLERALIMAENAVPPGHVQELALLVQARRLLGVERVDTAQEALRANLLKVRPV